MGLVATAKSDAKSGAQKTTPKKTAKNKSPVKAKPTKAKEPKVKNKIAPAHSRFENEANVSAQNMQAGNKAPPISNVVQAQNEGQDVAPSIDSRLEFARHKTGARLPNQLQTRLETHFSRDFSQVHIHHDAEAASLASALHARAFTLDNHVFFGANQYQPHTQAGQNLITHEFTHIVQQSGDHIARKPIQRTDEDVPAATNEPPVRLDEWVDQTNSPDSAEWKGKIELKDGKTEYTVPKLLLPKLSGRIKGIGAVPDGFNLAVPRRNFKLRIGASRSENRTNQDTIWRNAVSVPSPDDSVYNFTPMELGSTGSNIVYFLVPRRQRPSSSNNPSVLIGTKNEIQNHRDAKVPSWDNSGIGDKTMEIDHWREHQLGGDQNVDVIENLVLLDADSNKWAGNEVKRALKTPVAALIRAADNAGFFANGNENKKKNVSTGLRELGEGNSVTFKTVRAGERLNGGKRWTMNDITSGNAMKKLKSISSPSELRAYGIIYPGANQTSYLWSLARNSSHSRRITLDDEILKWNGNSLTEDNPTEGERFMSQFLISEAIFNEEENHRIDENTSDDDKIGHLTGQVFVKKFRYKAMEGGQEVTKTAKAVDLPGVVEIPIKFRRLAQGIGSAYLDRSVIRRHINISRANFKPGSPLNLTGGGLNDDWSIGGQGDVTATHPLFPGWEFSLIIEPDAILINAAIDPSRLDFGFFRVTEANLFLGFEDQIGLVFGGNAGFELENIGHGEVLADQDKLQATMFFDFDLFEEASVSFTYEKRLWSVSADLAVVEGKIPFVKSGSVHFEISEESGLIFEGEAELIIPGLPEPATITIDYNSEDHTLTIGGEITLNTSAIPGLSDTLINAEATYNSETGAWDFNGTGRVGINISGVTGDLTLTINNRAFMISGSGNVAVGNATGTLNLTSTNMPIDDEGNVQTEGEPTDAIQTFGSGSVTIQFGDYITGTAGIEYTPEGDILLSGEIALPDVITLFEQDEYDRTLLDFPRAEFPIFGITVPGIGSVGVFGFLDGEIVGKLTVGPGELRDTAVDIFYQLGDTSSIIISGGSQFVFTVDAGLELRVGGGLGLGAGVGDITGEVGITAALGIEVEGGAEVELEWTPQTGLDLDAAIFARGSPRFDVGVYAQAAVSVVVLGEVLSETWREDLASFGSDMSIEARLPAGWSEAEGLDLDINNLSLTYPDINIPEFAQDVMKLVVD